MKKFPYLPIALMFAAPALAEVVVDTMPFAGHSVTLDLGYPQTVSLKTWDAKEIRVEASVDLEDRSGDRNDEFRWVLRSRNGNATIEADFGDAIADSVVMRDGADVSGGIDKKTLVSGTELTIWLPRGVDVEVESESGNYQVEHNGGALLIESIGDISVILADGQGASVTASTLMGDISTDQALVVKRLDDNDNSHKWQQRQMMFEINGGGPEISLVTLVGSIRIEGSDR